MERRLPRAGAGAIFRTGHQIVNWPDIMNVNGARNFPCAASGFKEHKAYPAPAARLVLTAGAG